MTMASSRSKDSARSPIAKVPYDVLREIFSHCVPRLPLMTRTEHWQPNTMLAPMLLCQICSSWRTIALATPSLWTHLLYRVTPQYTDSEDTSWSVRQKDLDFLCWWKRNHGSMAPFLRFAIKIHYEMQDLPLAKDGLVFLLDYMSSAQHLQVDSKFWEQIRNKLAIEDRDIFPSLHTLETARHDTHTQFHRAQVLVGLVATHTPSALRRLSINGQMLPVGGIIPNHWSKLTHLSLRESDISVAFWYSLMKSLPDLEWAYICIEFDDLFSEYDSDGHIELPARYTHPRLSTLFFTGGVHSTDDTTIPLTLLFSKLYLPSLRTLMLSSLAASWEKPQTMSDICTMLRSMPALTTLTIRGSFFLSLYKTDYPTIIATNNDIEPIWSHASRLTHLKLELPYDGVHTKGEVASNVATFIDNVFLPNSGWLPLDDPKCPIQRVSFICPRLLDFHTTRESTMSSILSCTGGASKIIFDVIPSIGEDDGSYTSSQWGSRDY